MIIADENLHQRIIEALREKGYDVYAIRTEVGGVADTDVVQVAKRLQGILITEDKDFGELVYAHGIADVSIIFLRYDTKTELDFVIDQLFHVLNNSETLSGYVFITITAKKIRVNRL
jgi:predicted nuclease of predicted toxin-antitoxin system